MQWVSSDRRIRTRSPKNRPASAVKARSRNDIPKLSDEAKELLDDANATSSSANHAWLAFLALLAYLLVTLGGVSHKDLLLNSPVTLPIIDVEIPLFSFFQYAPLLLLLVYLSLLIQHVILARKYRKFVEAIAPCEKKAQHPSREVVDSYVVSQILAGPRHNLTIRWLMRLIIFVTFALLPIATLLYFQVKFLPYHAVGITYWHRIAVLLGLAMLFVALPIIHLKPRKREIKLGPQSEAWRASPYGILICGVLATLILGFSWLVATVPDEEVERRLLGFVTPARLDGYERLLNPAVRFAYDRLPQYDGRLLPWLVSYRALVVEDTDIVPDEDDAHGEVSVVLRERDLRFARLSRSDLHRCDLTKANLSGAQLDETRLEMARLQHTQLQDAIAVEVKLQGADLKGANLEGAMLLDAQFQGADLSEARLQGGFFQAAQFQGATLQNAQLQGADLSLAEFQGADLFAARLQGTNLGAAKLQGANLDGAYLQGADLTVANIWLASFPGCLIPNCIQAALGFGKLKMLPPTPFARAELGKQLQASVTNGQLLERLMDRLDPVLRDEPPKWETEVRWSRYISEAKEPSSEEFAQLLTNMTCMDPEGEDGLALTTRTKIEEETSRRMLARGLAQRAVYYSSDDSRGHYAKALAEALLTSNCVGAKGLSDEVRTILDSVASGKPLP